MLFPHGPLASEVNSDSQAHHMLRKTFPMHRKLTLLALFLTASCLQAAENGRYVRLEIPGLPTIGDGTHEMRRMLEIEVFSGGENVARKGTLRCSAGDGGDKIKDLIDGDTKDFFVSAFMMRAQINPWIEMDLGRAVQIDKVVIHSGNARKAPLMWVVSVLDADRKVLWYQRTDLNSGKPFVPQAMKGRYIGQALPEKASRWYSVLGEEPQERNFKLEKIDLPPIPDADQRRAAFAGRDSDQAVADLCRRFHAAVDPSAKGVELFRQRFEAGEYRGALEAYRDFFFDRLTNPEKHGVPADWVGSVWHNPVILGVDSIVAEEAMQNRRVLERDGRFISGEVGAPGSTRWTPRESITSIAEKGFRDDREGGAKSKAQLSTADQAEQEVLFFRMPEHTYAPRFFMFGDLARTYVATGEPRYLGRWMDYLDDWCLFGRSDVLNSPLKLTMGAESAPMMLFTELEQLQMFVKARPAFAKDMRATTLVRYVLALIEDFPPFGVRTRRSQVSNWGAGATHSLAADTIMLPEFHAMRYYARECVRLAFSSFLHQRTLDGENIEAGDTGHRQTDLHTGMRLVFNLLPLLPLDASFRMNDKLAADYGSDLLMTTYRNYFTRISPGGYDWPRWAGAARQMPGSDIEALRASFIHNTTQSIGRDVDLPSLQRTMPVFESLIEQEKEAGDRVAAMMDFPSELWRKFSANGDLRYGGKLPREAAQLVAEVRKNGRPGAGLPFATPERTSDIAPYSPMYFLRDKWEAGAECMMLFAFGARSQDHEQFVYAREGALLGYGSMRYDLMKDERPIVSSECIVVDKKAPNASHGAVLTGGKTNYSIMPSRNVVDTRFHTSTRFDLAEARRSDPYSRMTRVRGDWYNIWAESPRIDNTPITSITAYRQTFHVKGEGIWIVADRLEDKASQPREFSTFWTYPTWIEPKGMKKAIAELAAANHVLVEETQGRVRTAIPGAANISSRFFGPEHEMINRLSPHGEYVKIDMSPLALLKESLDRGTKESDVLKLNPDPDQSHGLRQVGIRWKGQGNQALVTLHNTRPAITETARQFENDLREIEEVKAPGGVTGFRAVTASGTRVEFQSGPNRVNDLSNGLAHASAESLLVIEREGTLSGIVLGAENGVKLRGKTYTASVADFEYVVSADGKLTSTPIYRAIDTVKVTPEQNVFTDSTAVSFSIPTQDTKDIEFRYTLDGSDPTLDSPLFTAPVVLKEDTHVKVRPFRKGLTKTPFNIPGELAGKTVGTIFRKETPLPAAKTTAALKPGLTAEYFEADWPTLFAHAGVRGVLQPKTRTTVSGLLNAKEAESLRQTEKAYSIRYSGYLEVPRTGVYGFHAPIHLYTPTMDSGYDLRLWIDGEEWFPSPTLHSENIWHIPLEAGLHRIEVSYADYRWKQFKNDYWMDWQEGQMWQGTPVLEVSGPGMEKQPLPAAWLRHTP